MLRERERPPEFILPNKATGGQMALADVIGQRRILILFTPVSSEAAHTQAFLAAAAQTTGLQERGVHILAICASNASLKLPAASANIDILIDATGLTAKQYGVSNGNACSYLIDRDGLIESAASSVPTIDELFAIVDAMPEDRNPTLESSVA